MFVTIESQFDRHGFFWFGAEDDLVRRFTSSVINAGIINERKFWCKRSLISASIVQKTSPITNNMLVLSFYFAVCPSWESCTWSQGNSQLFSPVDKVCVKKSCSSLMYYWLRNYKMKYPLSTVAIVACAPVWVTG